MSKSRAGVYFLVILAMIFWGFSFVTFKIANQSFRPITIVSFRLFVSIFFLFGFAWSFKRLNKIKRKDQKWFLLMAIAEPFFYFLGEAFGLTMVTATIGAVIISTIPLIVPFGAYYLYREKLTPMNYLGLVISFGGVLLVVLNKSGGLAANPLGILLMFVAVLSAVSYTLIVKRLVDDYCDKGDLFNVESKDFDKEQAIQFRKDWAACMLGILEIYIKCVATLLTMPE